MTRVILSRQMIDKVREALSSAKYEKGDFSVEVELDELTIVAQGWVDIDGYVEDDRDGTGAFVETHRAASVELTGWFYNHYVDEEYEVEIAPESVKEIDNYLNAA